MQTRKLARIVHAMSDVLYVSTAEELQRALSLLAPSAFVALDTEFMRESTYYPLLCLIQAATADACVIIDPLAVKDLQPLWDLLDDRRQLKVLHAARQDLEVMSQAPRAPNGVRPSNLDSKIPGPIFDTQLAAAFLGHPAQIGYGNLVAERLGRTLAKGHARTDWTRRPLSKEQLAYAADDVRYLVPLYADLHAALASSGRSAWLDEECRKLEDPGLFRTEPEDAWRRLKGLDRLRPVQRLAAKLLASWRETRAMKHDRPRGWILPDEALREVAERLPAAPNELEQLRTLPAGIVRKSGEELIAISDQARRDAALEPSFALPGKPESEQLARVTKLMAFVRTQAEEMKIAPELFATRRDIEQLVFSGRAEGIGSGWRREVIGERLIALAAN
jgi:ribonuclease D